jgi:adenylate kinase family enzyme
MNTEKDLSEQDYIDIKNKYLSLVEIPKNKNGRQFLLCPVGLVGAGKTTVLKPLSEKLNLVRISHDEIRKILKMEGFNFNKSKEIAVEMIKDFIKIGYSVSIDANCGSKETLEIIKKFENKYSLDIIWIHINPPEDFIVDKLKNFAIKNPHLAWSLFKDGEDAVRNYFDYKEKFGDGTNLRINFLYTFDTSRPNIDEQINHAIKLIQAKLHL